MKQQLSEMLAAFVTAVLFSFIIRAVFYVSTGYDISNEGKVGLAFGSSLLFIVNWTYRHDTRLKRNRD